MLLWSGIIYFLGKSSLSSQNILLYNSYDMFWTRNNGWYSGLMNGMMERWVGPTSDACLLCSG